MEIRRETVAHGLLGLILLVFLLSQFGLLQSFQSLPSPLYGGDYYHQLGAVNHVKDGGNPFTSFTTSGSTPSYLPTYTVIVGGSAWLFGLSGMTAMFAWSLLFTLAGILITYWLGWAVFDNPWYGLLAVVLYHGPRYIIKYTAFVEQVLYPAFLLALYYYLQNPDKTRQTVVLSVVTGLAGLGHGTSFLVVFPLLALIFAYYTYKNSSWTTAYLTDRLQHGLLLFGPGFLISLAYWWRPLLQFFSTGGSDFSHISYTYTVPIVGEQSLNHLFRFGSVEAVLLTSFVLVGSILPYLTNQIRWQRLTTWTLTTLLFPFHFLLTEPIFGFTLIPNHMIDHIYPVATTILAVVGAYLLIRLALNRESYQSVAAVGLILVFGVLTMTTYVSWAASYQWHENGLQPLPQRYEKATDWMRANTSVNTVYLSAKEVSSALNALSGRKFVSLRFNHVSKWEPFQDRELDQAIMLHTSNQTRRQELLNEYNVEYVVGDSYWVPSEFRLSEQGIQGLFDPLLLIQDEATKAALDSNGVNYTEQRTTIDPSKRNREDIKRFDTYAVRPSRFDAMRPWHQSFDDLLEPVARFNESRGRTVIYRVQR